MKLFISDTTLVFTDKVAGEKSSNGGEYGFQTIYYPTEKKGYYDVVTECTCDFDDCGTGEIGVFPLTVTEYQKLKKASDEVEAAGSLY